MPISSVRRSFFNEQLFEVPWGRPLRSSVNRLPIDTPGGQISRSPVAEASADVLEDATCRAPAREPLEASSEGVLAESGEETRMNELEDRARVRKGLAGVDGEAGEDEDDS